MSTAPFHRMIDPPNAGKRATLARRLQERPDTTRSRPVHAIPEPAMPQTPLIRRISLLSACAGLALAAGCTAPVSRATDALPADASAGTAMLAATKDMIDTLSDATVQPAPAPAPAMAAAPAPRLIGRGFAQVAGQPGATLNERRLLAMRAARLDALRDLTEQVHGISISSDSVLRDAVMRNDALVAHVQGTLRGARTLAIEPRGEDGYSVTLELDADTVAYVVRAVRGGA
jgi:hypothetical protein